MSKEDDINKINEISIFQMLRLTGYLPPLTEEELNVFDTLYKDYLFKLADVKIDPDKIMEGTFIKTGKVIKFETGYYNSEIRNLNMAARKGQDIPKEFLDKIKKKHIDLGREDDK